MSTTILKGLKGISEKHRGISVEFTARWDARLPPPDAPVHEVTLTGEQLERVPGVIRLLQDHSPLENQTVTGWIKTTSADALHEEGHPRGFAIVEVRHQGRVRDVRIELEPGVFAEARPGASMLTATGTLERIAARWHVTNPREVRVIRTAS